MRLSLRHPVDTDSALIYLNQLKTQPPHLFWRLCCFHYCDVTKFSDKYQTSQFPRQKKLQSEKIVTEMCCEQINFNLINIYDMTPICKKLEDYFLVNLVITKKIIFENNSIRKFYYEEKKRFIQKFRHKDERIEIFDELEFVNSAPATSLLIANSTQPSLLTSTKLHIVCSLLLLSWFLRLIIICKTAHLHFECIKIVGTNSRENINCLPPPASHDAALQPLPHGVAGASKQQMFLHSLVFANPQTTNQPSVPHVPSSSGSSLYSLEAEYDARCSRSSSVARYIAELLQAARKHIPHPLRPFTRTFSLNIARIPHPRQQEPLLLKRDISLPTELIAEDDDHDTEFLC